MVQERILQLADYGVATGLVPQSDYVYTVNRLLETLGLDEISDEVWKEHKTIAAQEEAEAALEDILAELLDDAFERGMFEHNSVVYRDLFDTKLMGCLVARPSEVQGTFKSLYENESAQAATDYFYKLSCDSNYIRRARIKKDLKWTTDTEFGTLDITINLSKPEKDPKAIAAAKNAKASSYPKCQLCRENEGYAGRVNHPARQNHRIIPVTINNSDWFFQYSPYVYYNEHCIVFNGQHTPMKIERATFGKLLDFVTQFPHYFVGSNADLPIVGGSILSHDHFQGGHYTFAMEKAPIEKEITFTGFEDVKAGIVKWPMSVIRITGSNKERLIELADKILVAWRGYTDEDAVIYAETNGEPHNTITPIARRRGTDYELDLVLRNNLTTEEHPLGVYHMGSGIKILLMDLGDYLRVGEIPSLRQFPGLHSPGEEQRTHATVQKQQVLGHIFQNVHRLHPSLTPMTAVTDLLGVINRLSLRVRPMLPQSSAAKISFWQSSGKSP